MSTRNNSENNNKTNPIAPANSNHHQSSNGMMSFGGMTTSHLGLESSGVTDTSNSALLGAAVQQALVANVSSTGRRDSLINNDDIDNDDSDLDDAPRGEKRAGRRKIRIEYIEDKSRRHITFSKRKAGIMKKAYELSTLTGTQVLLLVASETGHVYTFATPKLQPLITKPEGKNLIQACLNAPDTNQGMTADYSNSATNQGIYENNCSSNIDDDLGKEQQVYNERGSSTSPATNIPLNYAAAMAGLAGFQYPTSQSNTSNQNAAAAFLNPSHYPAYAAAQYNAALAAGFWPTQQGVSHNPQSSSGSNSTNNSMNVNGSPNLNQGVGNSGPTSIHYSPNGMANVKSQRPSS